MKRNGPTATLLCVLLCGLLLGVGFAIDRPVAAWVHSRNFSPAIKTALRIIRLPGYFGFLLVLAVLAMWPLRRHWRVAACLLVAGAGAGGVTAVLKWVFGRIRPFRGREAFDWHPASAWPFDGKALQNLCFPSGDATLAVATATVIVFAFPGARLAAIAWAAGVCFTRVLQGAHYPSNVTAGAITGMGFAILTCRCFRIGPTDEMDTENQLP